MLACVVALGLAAGCGSDKPPQSEGVSSPAQVVTRTIKLGPIFADEKPDLKYDVPVKNETDRPVRFIRMEQSCACAAGTKLAKMDLAHAEETMLHLEVDLRNRHGPQRFQCYLIDERGAVWSYSVQCTIYARAQFAEAGTVHFGTVPPRAEEARETTFLLNAESEEALPPVPTFRSDTPDLRVEVAKKERVRRSDGTAARRLTLKLILQAPEHSGVGQGTVVAEYERLGRKEQLQTMAAWNVRSGLSVAPAEVYFGTIDTASTEAVERRIIIKRTDGKPLEITGMHVPMPGVSCLLEPGSENSIRCLRFRLDPKAVRTALWGEVVVETDYESQPRLRIPVAALIPLSQ